MIVETIHFCQNCNQQHEMSEDRCTGCKSPLYLSKNNRTVTKININKWWKFWDRKYVAVFTPKEEFTSQLEFQSWKSDKAREYLSGDHHDVYFGKLKYI